MLEGPSTPDRRMSSLATDERGLAHTTGYIIVLGVFLVGGVSMFFMSMSLFGMASDGTLWQSAGSDALLTRAEVQNLHDGSSYRELSLESRPLTVSVGGEATVTVAARTVDGSDSSDDCLSPPEHDPFPNQGQYGCVLGQQELTSLQMANSQGTISLLNGGLFVNESDGGEIMHEPGYWGVTGNSFHFPLVNFTAAGDATSVGVSGEGASKLPLVLTVTGRMQNKWLTDNSDPHSLEVQVSVENTAHADLWATYVRQSEALTLESVSSDSVVFTTRTDRVVVSGTTVSVNFLSR